MAASPLSAEIVRCTDSQGATTYQEAPCPKGQQGRVVEMPPDKATPSTAQATASWRAAAAERRVVSGMPKAWVLQARGTPREIRPAQPGESGNEVWVYAGDGELLRVGFVADAVAWARSDVLPAQRPPPPVLGEGAQRIEARERVASGRSCPEVLQELGPPDAQEPVVETDPATGAPRLGPAATRYVYQPPPGGGPRLAFTCIDNRVIDVERTIAR